MKGARLHTTKLLACLSVLALGYGLIATPAALGRSAGMAWGQGEVSVPVPGSMPFGIGAPPPFRTFVFVAQDNRGRTDSGVAVLGGINGVKGTWLIVKIDCVRTYAERYYDRDTFGAMMTGRIIRATSQSLVGRLAVFGAIDGDRIDSTGPDYVNADFAPDLPQTLSCENVGMGLIPLRRGEVTVRLP